MSLEALEWVKENAPGIKGSHRVLLLEIADCIRKDEGGWGWSTRKRLLDRANVSRDVYQRAITALREAGIIEVDVHGGGDPDIQQNKQNRPNAYFFIPLLDVARREQLQEVRATNDARRKQRSKRTARTRPPHHSDTLAATTMPEGVVSAPSEGVMGAPSEGVMGAPSEGVMGAPSEGVMGAPSLYEDDPLVDPLVDPLRKSSSVRDQDPIFDRADDDREPDSRRGGSRCVTTEVVNRLANRDLANCEAERGPRDNPQAWLEVARKNRLKSDGDVIRQSIGEGTSDVDAIVRRVLAVHHDGFRRDPSSPTTVPLAESRDPAVASQRRQDQELAARIETEPPLPRDELLELVREAKAAFPAKSRGAPKLDQALPPAPTPDTSAPDEPFGAAGSF